MAFIKANVRGEYLMHDVITMKSAEAAKTLTCEIWKVMYQLANQEDLILKNEEPLTDLKEKAAVVLNLNLHKLRFMCPLCEVFVKPDRSRYSIQCYSDCPLKGDGNTLMGCQHIDSLYQRAMGDKEVFLEIIDACIK